MKRLLSIVLFCVLVPCAYGETINYDDGGKYVGEVSNGVPHGQGTYTFANADKYIGEWKAGKPWEGTEYNKNRNVIATYSESVQKHVNY